MGLVSGSGGSLYLQATYPGDAGDSPLKPAEFDTADNVVVPLSKWTLNKNPRLQEVTRSHHVNGSRYKTSGKDPTATIELPLDSAATAESKGLDQGITIPLVLLKAGQANLYYMLLETTVDAVEPVCDANGDIVRYRISTKGGDVSGPNTLAGLGLTVPP